MNCDDQKKEVRNLFKSQYLLMLDGVSLLQAIQIIFPSATGARHFVLEIFELCCQKGYEQGHAFAFFVNLFGVRWQLIDIYF